MNQLQPYRQQNSSRTQQQYVVPKNYISPRRSWWSGFFISAIVHWLIILLLVWSWTSYQETRAVTQTKICIVIDKDPIVHEMLLPLDCPVQRKPAPKVYTKPAAPRVQYRPPPPPTRVQKVYTPKPKPIPKPKPKPVVSKQKAEEVSRFLKSYIDKLRIRIATVKKYPPRSIAKRQEGIATVQFKINRTGRISEIQITETSGYALLDASALRALKLISPFDEIPQEVVRTYGKDSFTFAIPIKYSLSEIF